MTKTQKILSALKSGRDYTADQIREAAGLVGKSINVEVSQLVQDGVLEREGYGQWDVKYKVVDKRSFKALSLPMSKISILWGVA